MIISYIPGPNFDPVKATLNGCPTPLKLVSWFFIRSFTIGSNVSFFKAFKFLILLLNSDIIFLALLSISFKSSLSKLTSSKIIYLALLYISFNVLALFLRNIKESLIFSSLSDLIFSLYSSQYFTK